jgi:hypothetical protein
MIVEYYSRAIIINFRNDDGIIGKRQREVCGSEAFAVENQGDSAMACNSILHQVLTPSWAQAPVL